MVAQTQTYFMIQTIKKKTTVTFAKNQIGVIAIGVEKSPHSVIFQQMLVEKNVGEPLEEEEVQNLPSVSLEFTNAASIDVLIKALNQIKFNMLYPYGTLALAC